VLEVEPQLIDAYVRTGKMRIIVRPSFKLAKMPCWRHMLVSVPVNKSTILPCARAIYADQGGLYAAESMTAGLSQRARSIGLNGNDFDRCMQSDKYRLPLLTEYTRKDAGIVSRPVFEIDCERIIGAQQFAQFAEVINHLIP
jgi:hypothetical protein